MSTGANLGAATFTVNANTAQFAQGMQQAQQQMHRATSHMALGFLELSRAVEDAQYGFRSIVNNIPQMVMLFGGGAGLAGAISIVSVGINQLINHWGELTDAMQAAWSGSTLEQLSKIREGAEKAAESFDKLSRAPTKAQTKGAKSIEEAIVEGDAARIMEAVTAGIMQDPTLRAELTEDESKALGAVRNAKPEFRQGVEKRIFERTGDVDRKKAADLIGKVALPGAEGVQARQTLIRLAKANPGAFPADFAQTIEAAAPEAQKRQADFGKQLDVRKKVRERIKDQEREKRKELDDEIAGEHRIVQARKESEAGAARAAKEQAADAERAAEEAKHDARTGRHLRWRVQDIMAGARPERAKAEFMGFGDFAKTTQLGIMNNPVEIQKKQLEALKDIKRLLEDKPEMKANILAAVAVAGGPP